MLAPRDRKTLLRALEPPAGYDLQSALATTFTLDLTALLAAPLAFSRLHAQAELGRLPGTDEPRLDGYALLRAAREYAARMTVFCDATHIKTPAQYRPLFTYLEKSVVEVAAPNDRGVFHPKLWVLRFESDEADAPVLYRVLCSSRNLTFDRCWDTLLALDGTLSERTTAIARNRPLSEFIEALPTLAKPGVTISRALQKRVDTIADELLRVRFELPDGIQELHFHPMGIDGYEAPEPPERVQRALIVSPFVDGGGLAPWTRQGSKHVLVSRADELAGLDPSSVAGFANCYALAEGADGRADDGEELPAGTESEPGACGLHAKLFVVDDGWDAHVWTGSANATAAGFERNVEFLIQLTGKKSEFGVERFLNDGFSSLVDTWVKTAEIVQNGVRQELENRLFRLRRRLASVRWTALVGQGGEGGFPLSLRGDGADLRGCTSVWVRPITLSAAHERVLATEDVHADFGSCSLEALTCFFSFRVCLEDGQDKLDAEFVLKAALGGAVPADREARALAALLDQPGKVLQFLRLLLSDEPPEWGASSEIGRGAMASVGGANAPVEQPLLESLLAVLHLQPERIDAIGEVLRELALANHAGAEVPAGFAQVWEPIYAARQLLLEETRR